jgi:hypothetical protein
LEDLFITNRPGARFVDVWVVEMRARYDGGPWLFGPAIYECRDGKVARETIYVAEGWEAPEWRAKWRSAPVPDIDRSTGS